MSRDEALSNYVQLNHRARHKGHTSLKNEIKLLLLYIRYRRSRDFCLALSMSMSMSMSMSGVGGV